MIFISNTLKYNLLFQLKRILFSSPKESPPKNFCSLKKKIIGVPPGPLIKQKGNKLTQFLLKR